MINVFKDFHSIKTGDIQDIFFIDVGRKKKKTDLRLSKLSNFYVKPTWFVNAINNIANDY